jgi:polar amino acid transport system substrate-binding protein
LIRKNGQSNAALTAIPPQHRVGWYEATKTIYMRIADVIAARCPFKINAAYARGLAMKTPIRSAIMVLLLMPAFATAASPLKLQIVKRAPYLMIAPNGDVSGISVAPTIAAFKKAGIPITWEEVPALRQLQRLQNNSERVCSVGWYKTEERAQFAKFSKAVSQDAPWAAFANVKFNPPRNVTVNAILADSKITVLLKNGYVYGDYLDKQFAAMKAQREETSGDMPQLFKMSAVGRAQIAFAPLDEIQYYLSTKWVNASDLNIITFNEMPEGYKRYLMCSKQVEDNVIARFNEALLNQ